MLTIKELPFNTGHALQGAIEHYANLLIAHYPAGRKFGENRMADFDIDYNSKILRELVRMREHIEIVKDPTAQDSI